MNKTQIFTKALDLERKWKDFKELRTHGSDAAIENDSRYLSSIQREKLLEDFIYLFWLQTAKCFKEDEELKKLAFITSRCKRLQ